MDLFVTSMQLVNSFHVDYCDVFYQLFGLSFWRHPFTADNPLLSKGYDARFFQIQVHLKQIRLPGLIAFTYLGALFSETQNMYQ